MSKQEVQVIPIIGFPIVEEGNNLGELLLSTMKTMVLEFQEGDIIVISHTIASIVEGSMYSLSEIAPTEKARDIASNQEHSEEYIEIALQEATDIIREEPILITRTHQGIITDFSGVDESNAPEGKLIVLPKDPDTTARRIHERISNEVGFSIPVIVTDTQGRPWRRGAVNLAIGIAGMSPFVINKDTEDIYGKTLRSSLVCVADEIAASAELVMGQADEKVPIAIVRGIILNQTSGTAREILREGTENLFQ